MATVFDLERRTEEFTRKVVGFCKKVPDTPANAEFKRQLFKASGSVGANYIEANEALGKRDFLMKIKTSRRESKESRYWLRLLEMPPELTEERDALCDEATQYVRIFSSIIKKLSGGE